MDEEKPHDQCRFERMTADLLKEPNLMPVEFQKGWREGKKKRRIFAIPWTGTLVAVRAEYI
ncbi:MAG: hypothetical protein JJE48_03990 [Actinobacteria bacterium]|nr:hypothetical protein [Actinomycetota bacterium]